jgi:anionic cell wall polymer biosynthesis LytR-Cps2A-Psr (LCP) family protein
MNSFKQKWAGYSEKKKRILTALACILCFILLLSLFIALKLARIQYDPAPETEHEEPASTPAETDQQFAEKGRSTVNILVLGTDLPLPGTGDLGRCDSTTLLSLNLLTGQIKAISFERGISI